jgi:4-amino-4-deoxy-L-arabinose transferase-like glycosyltransferase
MRQNRALAALLAAVFATGLVYSVSTPILEASDEVRHLAVIEHYWLGYGLPVQDPDNRGFYEQEGSQPPLYYLSMAALSKGFDLSDFRTRATFNPHGRLGRADTSTNWNMVLHTEAEDFPWRGTTLFVHVVRILGVLFGLGTVWATHGIAAGLVEALGARGRALTAAPLLAAGLVGLNPMFLFISASINNDTLATLLSTLSLLLAVRGLRAGLTPRMTLALGLCLGGAALSKSSGLALSAVVPGVLGLSALARRGQRDPLLKALSGPVVALAIAMVIAGWFYLRNQILYGDFTGTQMMSIIAGPRERIPSLLELVSEYEGFARSYIGLFGAVNIPMADIAYVLFNSLLACAGAGLVLLAWRWRASARGLRASLLEPSTLPVAMLATVIVVALGALARWTSLTMASQGRLIFPTIGAVSALIAIGMLTLIGRLSERAARPAALAIGGGLGLLAVISPFAYIQPAYAAPPRLTGEQALPAGMTRTELRYGDAGGPALRWIGFEARPARVKDGERLSLTLYWQGLRRMDANFSVAVKLFGAGAISDTVQAGGIDMTPGRGMLQTSRWTPGEIIVEKLELPIEPSAGLPDLAELALDVSWYDFDVDARRQTLLKTYDGAGRETGRQRYAATGYAARPPTAIPETKQWLTHVRVGDTLSVTQTGRALRIATTWYVTRDFSEDMTVFMQVADGRGQQVAQSDGPPSGGRFPTRWWRAGDVIVDTRDISLPDGLAPGAYTLRFGLYRPGGDFARMPAFSAPGSALPDSALRAEVTVR